MLFDNTWYTYEHSVSCKTIPFSTLACHQIGYHSATNVDSQPTEAVQIVTCIFHRGLGRYLWLNILILLPLGDAGSVHIKFSISISQAICAGLYYCLLYIS